MLVNYYNPYSPRYPRHLLEERRSPPDVHYCLFDFDISRIFPRDAPLNACRSPSTESYEGTPLYHPLDTSCGEYDYNPFAYDVACLGNLYRIHFSVGRNICLVKAGDGADPPPQTIVPTIPLLAPLFDKMTTHVVAERFTAIEAADFIDLAIASVAEPALATPFTLRTEWESFENPDLYWARTTPEFRDHWAHFRAPKLPRISLLLMRLLESPKGWPLLCFVRRMLRV